LDFILIPSLFEPCGLTQLIAMHYGTIPIARLTGGLRDSVFDCEDTHIPTSKHNGFTFSHPTPEALLETLNRAIRRKKNQPLSHELLIQQGMKMDVGWRQPAKEYLLLYDKILKNL